MRLRNAETAKQRLLRTHLHLPPVESHRKDEARFLEILSYHPEVVSHFYKKTIRVCDDYIREAPANGSRGVSTP